MGVLNYWVQMITIIMEGFLAKMRKYIPSRNARDQALRWVVWTNLILSTLTFVKKARLENCPLHCATKNTNNPIASNSSRVIFWPNLWQQSLAHFLSRRRHDNLTKLCDLHCVVLLLTQFCWKWDEIWPIKQIKFNMHPFNLAFFYVLKYSKQAINSLISS